VSAVTCEHGRVIGMACTACAAKTPEDWARQAEAVALSQEGMPEPSALWVPGDRGAIAILKSALNWALFQIEDNEGGREGLSPEHVCEYDTNPDRGRCDFCEAWASAIMMLGGKINYNKARDYHLEGNRQEGNDMVPAPALRRMPVGEGAGIESVPGSWESWEKLYAAANSGFGPGIDSLIQAHRAALSRLQPPAPGREKPPFKRSERYFDEGIRLYEAAIERGEICICEGDYQCQKHPNGKPASGAEKGEES